MTGENASLSDLRLNQLSPLDTLKRSDGLEYQIPDCLRIPDTRLFRILDCLEYQMPDCLEYQMPDFLEYQMPDCFTKCQIV
ncbi:hypothetical protein CEXT_379881 [Caerostris extrusa]|uniref:Uncharacterized protein n=1 Tax=Caerostris extrusa TaxID=172846 RepID=A0AAV4MNH7_CAEEX|nr:hypothetical protein CEXT_379881 [Caerostris extrusa]